MQAVLGRRPLDIDLRPLTCIDWRGGGAQFLRGSRFGREEDRRRSLPASSPSGTLECPRRVPSPPKARRRRAARTRATERRPIQARSIRPQWHHPRDGRMSLRRRGWESACRLEGRVRHKRPGPHLRPRHTVRSQVHTRRARQRPIPRGTLRHRHWRQVRCKQRTPVASQASRTSARMNPSQRSP